MKTIILFAFSLILFSCSGNRTRPVQPGNSAEQVALPKEPADTVNSANESATSEEPIAEDVPDTELRFRNFTVIFHDFKGFDLSENEGSVYLADSTYAGLRCRYDNCLYNDPTIFFLQAKKDTVELSEFSNHLTGLENNLLEIRAARADSFSVSYAYLWSVNEIVQRKNITDEEAEKLQAAAFSVSGVSEFYPLKDSACCFFRTVAMPEYDNWATYVDGYMDKLKYESHLKKIKAKYHMQDTLVLFDGGEGGGYYGLLKKGDKFYGYSNQYYLFKITRFRNRKAVETKYIRVELAYGC